jgi:hypothetical protein
VAAKAESLRLECENLSAKVSVLRDEGRRISYSIGFQVSLGKKMIQKFLKDLDEKINGSKKAADQSLLSVKQQSLSIAEQAVNSLQTLDAEVRQQLDLFQKIGASAEFSPLIKAARGQYVDLDELRTSVIRAMGIMHSRLKYIQNNGTKDLLQKAIESLESELLIPN